MYIYYKFIKFLSIYILTIYFGNVLTHVNRKFSLINPFTGRLPFCPIRQETSGRKTEIFGTAPHFWISPGGSMDLPTSFSFAKAVTLMLFTFQLLKLMCLLCIAHKVHLPSALKLNPVARIIPQSFEFSVSIFSGTRIISFINTCRKQCYLSP